MLTGDLVRAKVSGKEIAPSLVKCDRPALVSGAQAILSVFQDGIGETSGVLDEAVTAQIGDTRDHKILRGLAKVVRDRSTFDVASPLPPEELRDRVFRHAASLGPLALEAGPLGRPTASDVLAEIAASLETTPEVVARALYADLKQEQRLISCDVPDETWLLHRYNVSLVQALLLHASEVRIRLSGASVPRLRQFFRWVKFFQLIHHATLDGEALSIVLDGPTSLFRQSSRYGMQLANFLPALLLQTTPWTLEATILWTRRRVRKTLRLSSEDGLRSHYRDVGAYETQEQRWFSERYAKIDTPWALSAGQEPLLLGGRGVLLPDFSFTNGQRTAHLEIVGYWRKDWLARRVALLREWSPGNLILAISRKLRGSKEALEGIAGVEVVEFASIVPPKKVLEAVERVAR